MWGWSPRAEHAYRVIVFDEILEVFIEEDSSTRPSRAASILPIYSTGDSRLRRASACERDD